MLYRHWKGQLVTAEPCRCAQSGNEGMMVSVLTGQKRGQREWREHESFYSEPRPGVQRYSPVPDQIPWCPISALQSVFLEQYPDTMGFEIHWVPDHDTPGATYYLKSGKAVIAINPDLTLLECISVLMHEFAHIAVPPAEEAEDHGPKFNAVLDNLKRAWQNRLDGLATINGLFIYKPKEKKDG